MSLKRQTLWSMAPLIVVTVVNIVSVPLFYRFLGAELYALWFYVLTFAGAFGFMDLGLGVAVGRYIGVALGKKDLQAVREYWGTGNAIAIPLLAVMGLLFGIIGVAFGPRWFNVDPALVGLLRWSFIAGAVGLFLSYYGQFWLILSQAHLDFRFIAILRTATVLLQVVPSIYLAWATRSPLILIIWSAVAAAFQLSIFTWHGFRKYRLGFNLENAGWNRAKEMAAYTGKTFAMLLTNSVLGSADRLVLGKLAPPADFAHYSISTNVGGRIQGLSAAVMGPVFSHSSRSVGGNVSGGLAAVYNETFGFTFPWYVLISTWIFLWHPVLLRLWLGPELGAAVAPILVPITIGYCLTAVSNISGAQLGPIDRLGTGIFFVILTGVLLVFGVYAGWLWMGIVGVAWGFVFSRIGLIAQDLFVITQVGAGGWLALSTWKTIAAYLALGLVFAVTYLILPRYSVWNILPAIVHGLIGTWWIARTPVQKRLAGLLNAIRSRPA